MKTIYVHKDKKVYLVTNEEFSMWKYKVLHTPGRMAERRYLTKITKNAKVVSVVDTAVLF